MIQTQSSSSPHWFSQTHPNTPLVADFDPRTLLISSFLARFPSGGYVFRVPSRIRFGGNSWYRLKWSRRSSLWIHLKEMDSSDVFPHLCHEEDELDAHQRGAGQRKRTAV